MIRTRCHDNILWEPELSEHIENLSFPACLAPSLELCLGRRGVDEVVVCPIGNHRKVDATVKFPGYSHGDFPVT